VVKSFTYQAPYVKSATSVSQITDAEGVIVGSAQRYYPTVFHQVIDALIGDSRLIVRFRAFNASGTKVIEAVKKVHMIAKSDYYIKFLDGDLKGVKFHVRQKNLNTINPEYLIKGNDIEGNEICLISKTSMFDWVRFYENELETARWKCVMKEKFKTYLEIEETATLQDPLFYATLGQILYFVGD